MITPLYEFSFPCNVFGMGYIFSHSFFLTHLVGVWHTFFGYASFFLFLYSPYILMITLERNSHGTTWSFICGWMGDVLAIFQCRSIACEWTCT